MKTVPAKATIFMEPGWLVFSEDYLGLHFEGVTPVDTMNDREQLVVKGTELLQRRVFEGDLDLLDDWDLLFVMHAESKVWEGTVMRVYELKKAPIDWEKTRMLKLLDKEEEK